MDFYDFPYIGKCHDQSQLTNSYFSEGLFYHQPEYHVYNIIHS